MLHPENPPSTNLYSDVKTVGHVSLDLNSQVFLNFSLLQKELLFCPICTKSVHRSVLYVLFIPKFVPFVPESLSQAKNKKEKQKRQKGQCNPLQYWIFSEKLIRNRRTKLLFELESLRLYKNCVRSDSNCMPAPGGLMEK